MKLDRKKLVLPMFAVCTIAWTWVIFRFSLQPAVQSSAVSGGIVAWLTTNIFAPIFGNVPNLEFWVRKLAHFCEYGLLGFLATITLCQIARKRKFAAALGYGILVAVIDETIQRFVPGRSGQISDVLLDSTGALCGVFVIWCFCKIWEKRKCFRGNHVR